MSTQFKIGDVVEVVRPDWGGLRFVVDRLTHVHAAIGHVSGVVVRSAVVGGEGANQGRVDTINRVFRLGGSIGFGAREVRLVSRRSFGQWYKEHS